MDNIKTIEQEWRDKYSLEADHIFALCAEVVIRDFKAALKEALIEDRDGYTQKRDGWKEGSDNYEFFDLAVRCCNKHINLIDQVKPKS